MIQFIFFGRLTHEKGIDLIIETFLELAEKRTASARSLDIYGAGPFADACTQASLKYPDRIHFYGRTPQKEIRSRLSTYDYCLMPSRVVETFGKSAAEALASGVQVIGYRHGGLTQFIDPVLAIGPLDTDFSTLIEQIIDGRIQKPAIPDLSSYSPQKRLAQIAERMPQHNTPPRILLVSDFITSTGGGIETFLHETQSLLMQHGYEVQLCGSSRPVGFLGLLATAANIRERRRVRAAIHHRHPDVIRYHSTLRRMGRLPMTITPHTDITPHAQKWRMMHDMGYVYPHPAQLTSLDMIPQHHTLKERLATVCHRNLCIKILTVAKRILQKCISFALRRYDHIVVPSEFMRPYATQLSPHTPIDCLPHFVTK